MKKKVMIVDDDKDMLLLLNRILTAAEYEVFKAQSGKECIEKIKKIMPDILILDIMMPQLDGVATVLKLKSMQETRNIPIIISTAVKEMEDRIVAQNLGVADYVRKTAQMEGLVEKIKTILNK